MEAPSLFNKEKQTTPAADAAANNTSVQLDEATGNAKKIQDNLELSLDKAKVNLTTMVDKAIRCELALSKVVKIESDSDDEVVNKLLVKSRNTYNEIMVLRKEITEPIDNIKDLAMLPEKRISIEKNQPNSAYNRVKNLRDGYANEKLKKQREAEAKATALKNKNDELTRLKAVFEQTFFNNVLDTIATMESNIEAYYNSLTLDDFDKKAKRFSVKLELKKEVFESWFKVPFDSNKLSQAEFDEFVTQVKTVFTYETINQQYVDAGTPKLQEWRDKVPARKQELIELAELEKTNTEAAEAKRKEIEAKAAEESNARTAELDEIKNQKAAEVQEQTKSEMLENEFEALKVTQSAEQIKGALTKKIATIDCAPGKIVEVISKIIYVLFTVPVANPTFHLKKLKGGVIAPPDEDGRPQYEDWLETLLTQFAKTDVSIDEVKIKEVLSTIQRSK